MTVVQTLAKKVMICESQDGRNAHIIGNSVSGERYRTTMVLLFKILYFLNHLIYGMMIDVSPKFLSAISCPGPQVTKVKN